MLNYDYQRAPTPELKAELDWMVRQFAKIDIQLEIRATDYNQFQDKVHKGTHQIFWWGWLADYPDAENFLFLLYGPNTNLGGSSIISMIECQTGYLGQAVDAAEAEQQRAGHEVARPARRERAHHVRRRSARRPHMARLVGSPAKRPRRLAPTWRKPWDSASRCRLRG